MLWISVLACVAVLASAAPANVREDVLADLREILEDKLKQRKTRQHDEILSDVEPRDQSTVSTGNQKNVKAREADDIFTNQGWTQEEIETLYQRLPEDDVRILREFAKLAVRLNTARRLVLELNKPQAKPKRAQDHPISGFDSKYVGTREQDMKADGKMVPKQKPSKQSDSLGTDVDRTDDDGGQWLNHPISKDEIDKALSLLNATNNLRKRQDADAAPAVAEPTTSVHPIEEKKTMDKELENAVLTAILAMKEKTSDKSE